MKKIIIVNDLTGKELTDHIHISIEKPSMMIEYPKGNFTNRLEVDIEEKDIHELLGKIKYSAPLDMTIKTIEVVPDGSRLS
jgi:hypothetical protein